MPLDKDEVAGLRKNSLDSMRHAYDHFLELALERQGAGRAGDKLQHHAKWVILSVDHAADCLLQQVLNDVDPNNMCFEKRRKDGERHHPSFLETLRELEGDRNAPKLKASETILLRLLRELIVERDRITHRRLSEDLDRSVAAFAMLAIRRVLRARCSVPDDHFGWQEHEVLADVLSAISAKRYSYYFAYVEQALTEEHPDGHMQPCPYCETVAVLHGAAHCEACFIDLQWIECPRCGNESPHPSEPMIRKDVSCPFCAGEQ